MKKQKAYALIGIFFFCFLLTIEKNNVEFKFLNIMPNLLRNLYDDNKINDLCKKSEKNIFDKFKNQGYEKELKEVTLDKYQTAILNYIDDSDGKYIKDYLPHVAIFFVFIALDIIVIGSWITYCACCCCPRCIFLKNVPQNPKFPFICFLISIITAILSLIFGAISFGLFYPLKRRTYSVGCSILKLIDHLRDGVSPDYTNINWNGTIAIRNTFSEANIQYKEIENMTLFETASNAAKYYYSQLPDQAKIEYQDSYNLLNEATSIIDIKEMPLNFSLYNQLIERYDNIFKDVEKDYLDDIYDGFKDIIKVVNILSLIFFIILIVICAIGIISLFLFVQNQIKFSKIIYIVIWNIELLLVIIFFIYSALFGLVSYASDDLVPVIDFLRSKKNLDSPNSVFIKYDPYITNYVDTCFNGNGEFTAEIDEKKTQESAAKLSKLAVDSQNMIVALKSKTTQPALQELFTNCFYLVLSKVQSWGNFYQALSPLQVGLNCGFVPNDLGILIHYLKSTSNRAIVICAFCFCVAALLWISVFFGILALNKYSSDNIEYKANATEQNFDSGTTTSTIIKVK